MVFLISVCYISYNWWSNIVLLTEICNYSKGLDTLWYFMGFNKCVMASTYHWQYYPEWKVLLLWNSRVTPASPSLLLRLLNASSFYCLRSLAFSWHHIFEIISLFRLISITRTSSVSSMSSVVDGFVIYYFNSLCRHTIVYPFTYWRTSWLLLSFGNYE